MREERTQQRLHSPNLSEALNNIKGDIWKQDDIRKRHLKFIEEQNSKRAKQNLNSSDWSSYLNDDLPAVRSPIANLSFNQFRQQSQFIIPLHSQRNERDKNKSTFQFYNPKCNNSYGDIPFLKKTRGRDLSQMKELKDTLNQKDAQIRRLKKQNVNLKSQLKTQVNEIQNETKFKLNQQQQIIEALHLQLKQLVQPKGIAIQGRSFYAQQLERQISSLQQRLSKANESNQDLEHIITSLYSQNNGSVHNNISHTGRRSGRRAKILQCLSLFD